MAGRRGQRRRQQQTRSGRRESAQLMDELMSSGSEEDDDDATESDSDRHRRSNLFSESESDADFEPIGFDELDDEGDEGDDGVVNKDAGVNSGSGGTDTIKVQSASAVVDPELASLKAEEVVEDDGEREYDLSGDDDGDDDDDDDDDDDPVDDVVDEDDDDDDDEDETEADDDGDAEDVLPLRQLSAADLEREAQYQDEEDDNVVKEELGLHSLFGDGDDDGDSDDGGEGASGRTREVQISAAQHESSAEDEDGDDAASVDSKAFSFTDALVASSVAGSVANSAAGNGSVADSAEAQDGTPLRLHASERHEAKTTLLNLVTNVSRTERRALKRGIKLDGPPIDEPISHLDEFKRKFRWPLRMINLPHKDFSQDPLEIYNDYELSLQKSATEIHYEQLKGARRNDSQPRAASAFAHAPSPIVEAAAAAVRQQQLSRKRKRSKKEEIGAESVSAAALSTIARLGERFSDRLLESLLSDNAAALQGTNDGYLQRSWTPLPLSRKPVANWRFVFENAMRNSASGDRLCPPLRRETLQRIRDRLKTLHSLPWKTEDDELFERPERQEDIPELLPDASAELASDDGIIML